MPSLNSRATTYPSVPQSSSVTITSWEISTILLVKYPESAVLKAVSVSPLREPCVEIKYSCTESPSRKLAFIGISMIFPSALDISPRIPPNCLIWFVEPRAPESANILILLSDFNSSRRAAVTSSVASLQISITFSYLSLSVINPRL